MALLPVHEQFFSLLCLILIFSSINGNIHIKNSNYDLTLAETSKHIIRKYFSEKSTTVVVVERSFHSEFWDDNNRILEYILQNVKDKIAVQLYCGKSDTQPWEFHVLIVDSLQAFLIIASNLPENNFDGDFRFLIILTNHTSNDFVQTIQGIFEACRKINVINVNILLNQPELGVCMYKYKIFSETKCHAVQPFLYFRQSDGFENLTEIFPQMLMNFHKCSLRICAQQNHPMLTFSGNMSDPKPYKNWNNLRGIDGQLIRIVARNLNFTINLLPFPSERSYMQNKTGFGCFAKLLNHEADIAVGGFSGSDPKRIALTPSLLYYHSPIVFIIRGRRELDCANRLGRPFSITLWQCIIGLLLAGVFLIQTLRILEPADRQIIIGEQNYAPLLNFFAVFLGYPVTRTPRGYLARYFLIIWLIMTLILRSAYQGSLYDSIRIDRFEKVPKKYDELFASNYKFFITKFYFEIGIFPRNQTIISDQKHYERLELIAGLDGNYATIALLDHVISYLEMNFRNGTDLKIIDEQVYQYQSVMFLEKHSIYATPLNNYLNKFNYAGIIRHIARSNAKDRRVFRQNRKAVGFQAITNNRIWSLYKVFVRLMIVTTAIFALELTSMLSVKVQMVLDWFH